MLGGNPEGMAKVELKKRGVKPDDPSYEELEKKLTEEFEAQIKPDNEGVIEAGGLYVVGTERHESRRIDNSCVVDLVARATQVSPGSIFRWRTT